MLKIRLQRVGRVHEPRFRLVLTDSKNSTKSGRFKEILGSYDPRKTIDSINADRVKHWLGLGAKATGTVHNLLVSHKVIDAKKVNVLPRKSPPPVETKVEVKAALAPVEAAPAVEAPAVEETAPAPVQEDTKSDTIEEPARTTGVVQSGGVPAEVPVESN